MAEKREILFSFEVTENELQKQLVENNGLLIKQREQLKALNKEYRDSQKVIASYDKELQKLNDSFAAGEITQEEYNESLNQLNSDFRRSEQVVSSYAAENTRLKEEIKATGKEVRDTSKDLINLTRANEAAEGSNEQLRARLSLLTKEYNKLSREQRDNTDTGQALTKQIREISDALKENERAVGDNRRNVGNYQDAFKGLGGGILETVGSLAGPGGLVAGIGLATEAIKAGAEEVARITKEFVTFRGEAQKLTGETGKGLDQLTESIASTSKVFEQDFNEVLLSANALSQQLGLTQTEAAELIRSGFLSGANASGELLDVLKEYPSRLRDIGLTGDQAISLLTQSVQEGVFSDKGIDAIAEATEKLSLLEEPTRKAIENLGLSPEELQQLPIFEAVQRVSAEIDKLPPKSKQATEATNAIFGTPGLDAGEKFIRNLQNVSANVDELIDKTNPLVELQLQQLEVNDRLAEAQNELSKVFEGTSGQLGLIGKEIQIFLIERLLQLIEDLQPVIDGIKALIDGFIAARDALDRFGNSIRKFLLDLGLSEELVDKIGAAFTRLKDIIVGLFTGNIFRVFALIREQAQALLDFITSIPNRLKNAFNDALSFINDTFGTGFEVGVKVNVDTGEAEKAVTDLNRVINQRPPAAPIDLKRVETLKEAARLGDELTDEEKKTQAKRLKEQQKALKIRQKNFLENERNSIKLALLEVQKGSAQELELQKELLETQKELTLVTSEQTQAAELLLVKQTNLKKIDLENQFQAEKLEVAVAGLEQTRQLLSQEIDLISQTNATERQEGIKTNIDLFESEQSKAVQTVELEREAAEEQKEISRALTDERIADAAKVLQAVSSFTSSLTNFVISQRDKELQNAQGNAEKEAEINEKFAKREKQLAVFQSIINTGVAVVKALPNIPLSILVGTIGAINTAAIASQSFADGGFTGNTGMKDPKNKGRKIVGVVHDNEYVIPSSVLSTNTGMGLAMQAERMRKLPGFVSGGFTSGFPTLSDGGLLLNAQTSQTNQTATLGTDFQRAVQQLPQPVVGVDEITRVSNRVATKETTSGL